MHANPTLFQERLALAADVATARAIVDRLQALLYEPNAKRYTRSRTAITAAWMQLYDTAEKAHLRMEQAQAQPAKVKRPRKERIAQAAEAIFGENSGCETT